MNSITEDIRRFVANGYDNRAIRKELPEVKVQTIMALAYAARKDLGLPGQRESLGRPRAVRTVYAVTVAPEDLPIFTLEAEERGQTIGELLNALCAAALADDLFEAILGSKKS